MGGQGYRAVTLDASVYPVIQSGGQPGSVTVPRQQRYEQVADDLKRKIESGEYPPGSRMPSRRELCQMFDVSESVIEKAMWILRREGLTETLPGVGVFVAENPVT